MSGLRSGRSVQRPDGSEGNDLYLGQEAFREPLRPTLIRGRPQRRPWRNGLGRPGVRSYAVGPAGVEDMPRLYLLGAEDNAIPLALERFMAERANATIVEARLRTFVAFQPEAATELILQAVEATTAAG